jgi:hypothetical protein
LEKTQEKVEYNWQTEIAIKEFMGTDIIASRR